MATYAATRLSVTNTLTFFLWCVGREFRIDRPPITLAVSKPAVFLIEILSCSVPMQIFRCSVESEVLHKTQWRLCQRYLSISLVVNLSQFMSFICIDSKGFHILYLQILLFYLGVCFWVLLMLLILQAICLLHQQCNSQFFQWKILHFFIPDCCH